MKLLAFILWTVIYTHDKGAFVRDGDSASAGTVWSSVRLRVLYTRPATLLVYLPGTVPGAVRSLWGVDRAPYEPLPQRARVL